MKLTLKNLIISSIVLAVVGFFLAMLILSGQIPKNAFASVSQGSEYQSYMATSTNASATTAIALKTTTGTLGSIVITQAATTGAYFRVWDATSTATSTYQNYDNTSTSTTYGRLVAQVKTTATEGTYTFDASMFKGVVLEVPSSWNGIYSITYR